MKIKQYNQYHSLLNSLDGVELLNCKAELTKLISCKDWNIRSRVATFLSDYNEPYAEQLLCKMIFDKNWIVRSSAVQSLEEIGTNDSLEYLFDAFKKEKYEINIPVFIFCITNLFLRNDLAIDLLVKWLYQVKIEYYKNRYIVPYILSALIILKKNDYFDELISLYECKDNEMKLSVLTSLEYICDFEIDYHKNDCKEKILDFINEINNDDASFPYLNYKILNIKNKM